MSSIFAKEGSLYEHDIHALYSFLKENLPELYFVEEFQRASFYHDEPKFYTFTAEINVDNELRLFAGGTAWDKQRAAIKTIFEAVERYSLARYDFNGSQLSRHKDIKDKYVSLESFYSFSHSQMHDEQLEPFIAKTNSDLYWTEAQDLINSEPTFLPAQLIYVPFDLDDKFVRMPITTGAASGLNREATLGRAMLEVIERDAFITSYLGALSGKKLEVKNATSTLKGILGELKWYGLKPHMIELESDFPIPTILTILEDTTSSMPAITMGLKCHPDYNTAIIGSIEESFHSRTWLRHEAAQRDENYFHNLNNTPAQSVSDIPDRGLLWSLKENKHNLNFWLENTSYKTVDLEDGNNMNKLEVSDILEILKSKKFDCYVKDLPKIHVGDIAIYSLKVVIPQAHPLYLDEYMPYLSVERLKQITDGKVVNIVNTLPQPFL